MTPWDKTLVVDFDETICEPRPTDTPYRFVSPKPDAKEVLNKLRDKGWKIVIHTASGMGSYQGNLAEIERFRKPEIIEWLHTNEIPFDDLIIGKPLGRIYLDDKAMKFNNWKEVEDEL